MKKIIKYDVMGEQMHDSDHRLDILGMKMNQYRKKFETIRLPHKRILRE